MFKELVLFFYRATAAFISVLALMPCQLSKLPDIDVSKAQVSVIEESGFASRVMPLSNSTLIGGYEVRHNNVLTIKTKISYDGGATWKNETIAAHIPDLDCANVNFYEKDGVLYLAYRAIGYREDGSFYGSIQVSTSNDFGLSWTWHSLVVENTEETGVFKGVWEPCLGEMDGKLVCVYANDSTSVTTYQNIESKTFDGNKWTDRRILSNGEKHKSRDGMPVWCHLPDGGYAMVIESSKYSNLKSKYHFVVQVLYSDDGIKWSEPYDVYIPSQKDREACAPGICVLNDGRLAITFQTDEDRDSHGSAAVSVTKMIFSDGKKARPKSPLRFSEPQKVFPPEHDAYSLWGGIHEAEGKIYYSAGTPKGAVCSIITYSV